MPLTDDGAQAATGHSLLHTFTSGNDNMPLPTTVHTVAVGDKQFTGVSEEMRHLISGT